MAAEVVCRLSLVHRIRKLQGEMTRSANCQPQFLATALEFRLAMMIYPLRQLPVEAAAFDNWMHNSGLSARTQTNKMNFI